MNIFYDGIIFTWQRYGGISRYFMGLAIRMVDRNDSNLFLFRFPDSFNNAESMVLRKPIMLTISIPKIRGILGRIDSIRLPRLVRDFKSDIYHTTYYRIPEGIEAPKVITVYDMIHEKLLKSMKGVDAFLQRKKRCIERADKVIAISENTKRDILEYVDIPEEKIAVTYLAASRVFKEATEDEKLQLRREYDLEKPFILYVGNRGTRYTYKNFDTLLRAYSKWSRRPEFDLVCFGGLNYFSENESEIIEKAKLGNSVKLFTGMDDDKLRVFYSCAYVFVYPSIYEGFGIPTLEAMACNTPVIASNASSVPEVVGDAGLYFDPSSEDELMVCLDRMADDAQLSKLLVERGRDRAKLFNWEKTATQTYEIYKTLQ